VEVAGHVPHGPILPSVDVVVGHGGLSTITGALAAGTPLVIIPQGRDQDDNAERVHATGVGLSLPRDAAPAAIAAAIRRVLHEPSFRIAAQRMGADIATAGRGAAAAAIVDRIAGASARTRPASRVVVAG
jgi:UDP:flavonoid glycosyltransferase YjiC (YdhE family)